MPSIVFSSIYVFNLCEIINYARAKSLQSYSDMEAAMGLIIKWKLKDGLADGKKENIFFATPIIPQFYIFFLKK